MTLRTFISLCNHQHTPPPKLFHLLKLKLYPLCNSLPSTFPQPWQLPPSLFIFYIEILCVYRKVYVPQAHRQALRKGVVFSCSCRDFPGKACVVVAETCLLLTGQGFPLILWTGDWLGASKAVAQCS